MVLNKINILIIYIITLYRKNFVIERWHDMFEYCTMKITFGYLMSQNNLAPGFFVSSTCNYGHRSFTIFSLLKKRRKYG